MKVLRNEPKEQASPLIVQNIALTDEQFNTLLATWKEITKETIKQITIQAYQDEIVNRAPYLDKTKFAKWSGKSVATIDKYINQGLPVAKVEPFLIGKETYINFLKSRERSEKE